MTILDRKPIDIVLIATLVILLLSIVIKIFDLDMLVSHYFYQVGVGFPHKTDLFVRFFYQSIPVAVTTSLLFFIAYPLIAYKKKSVRKYNYLVLALFISMLVGPGLIVNSIFKDNFGRPRPSQSIEFGGKHQARELLEANWGNYGKSFPSGHAAVPLSFLVLAFAAARRKKIVIAKRLAIGIFAWYLAVSYARIAAGGHHFSDVIWAGYFSFICAWLSYLYIERRKN